MKNFTKSFLLILVTSVVICSSFLLGCKNPFMEGVAPVKIQEYTVSYKCDVPGVTLPQSTVVASGTVITLQPLSVDGYVFDGWYVDGNKVEGTTYTVTNNVVFEARFTKLDTIRNFIVMYRSDVEQAPLPVPNILNVQEGTLITLNDLEIDGYEFDGWYVDGEKIQQKTYEVKSDVTFEARFILLNGCSISFKPTPADLLSKIPELKKQYNVTKGTEFTLPTLSEVKGYTFVGWYVDGNKVEGTYTVNKDVTFEAKFEAIPTYSVTFKDNIGNLSKIPESKTYIKGDKITLNPLSVAGYTFEGWYVGNEKVEETTYTVTEDVTLEARFTKITTYAVSYITNVDKEVPNLPKSGEVIKDTIITLPILSLAGYEFDGWYVNGGKVEGTTYTITSDTTFEAKFSGGAVVTKYSVSYTKNVGVNVQNFPVATTVAENTKITLSPLSLEGYEFDGWFVGDKKVVETYEVKSNVVFEARFTLIPTYSVTYKKTPADISNITLPNSETVREGALIELDSLTHIDYTFDGWYVNGNKVNDITYTVNSDVTFEAKFTPIPTFSVSYRSDISGAVLPSQIIVKKDKEITLEPVTANGYQFVGWYINGVKVNGATYTVTSDITFEAKFIPEGVFYPLEGDYSPVDINNWGKANYSLGATVVGNTVEFGVYSANADKILLEIYDEAYGVDASYYYWMEQGTDKVWRAKISGIGAGTLYAFRAWGPNWTYESDWKRGGSNDGFKLDVDDKGNRFNPNKVLFDPYAKEISHDKSHPEVLGMVTGATGSDGKENKAVIYSTGNTNKVDGKPSREFDTGKYAPKAVVVNDNTLFGTKPKISQEKAIIYEAHVRGITNHESATDLKTILSNMDGFSAVNNIPAEYRGTYKGAGMLAPYLKALGVNTIELLPVHESDNDGNPDDNPGGNYWAYMTYGYFAPDRRYSSDKTLGGPTREFKEMVKAFHDVGMEVYLDVVFNHSGEGGTWFGDKDSYNTAELTFMRGLDNSSWYCITTDTPGAYWETTGCGNNLQCDNPMVGQMVLDSLTYWIEDMGVDGYRFDLAPVVGREGKNSWNFNSNSKLLKDIAYLGETNNVEMIAEAWDCSTYQVGQFPSGWGEWNGRYRDAIRGYVGTGNWKAQGDVGKYIFGDKENFEDQGGPHKSVNFIVAHDGFTLADLCSYAGKGNNQNQGLEWPFGPSDGGNGDDNWLSFVDWQASEEDQKADKRQANRNYIAIQMMSRGVPMIVWGDEFSRTQNGNNNPYNIDSVCGWSNYNMINTASPHEVSTGTTGIAYHNNFGTFKNKKDNNDPGVNGNFKFMNYMLKLRANEPALNQKDYTSVEYIYSSPSNYESGDVMIHIKGSAVDGGSDYLLLMNMTGNDVKYILPAGNSGKEWVRIVDTQDWYEGNFNYWQETEGEEFAGAFDVKKWSVVIFKEVNAGTAAKQKNYLYLKPNANWKTDNARFAAYYFKNGSSLEAGWYSMYDVGSNLYVCEIPPEYTQIIFCRMNPNDGYNDWKNKWNQTGDLYIPTDGKNLYTINEDSWDNGSWSKK